MSGLWAVLLGFILALLPPTQAADLTPGYWERTPLPETGLATYYAPGVMEYVHDYRRARGEIGDCPECVGEVALLRAGDIGRKVWLQRESGARIGPFLVIDCAHTDDVAPLLARNWVVDVSYQLGQIWDMSRPLEGVTVLEDPADILTNGPLRAPTPFRVAPPEVLVTGPTPTAATTIRPPTPWPTRLPADIPRALATRPAATPVPPKTPQPTPLTPIVTTPTPIGSPGTGSNAPVSPPPQPTEPAAPALVTPQVAVGRPGSGLLEATPWSPAANHSLELPAQPTATSVATRTRYPTPLVTSPPILRPTNPAPVVQHGTSSSSFLSFWQSILDALLR